MPVISRLASPIGCDSSTFSELSATPTPIHPEPQSSPTLRRHVAGRLAATTPTPELTVSISFPNISPLESIVLQRGRARFRVEPYSITHAYMTGHAGTPTRRSSGRTTRTNIRSPVHDHLVGSLFGISPEEADITTPNIRRVYARLLPAIGDTPQAKPLSDLNRQTGSPSGQHSNISTSLRTTSGLDRLVDAAVAALKTESPLQSSDSGSEEDTPRPSLSIAVPARNPTGPPNDDLGSEVSDLSPFPVHDYITMPLEEVHRRIRSPYLLRRNRYPVTARIREQVRAVGQPLDLLYLREAGIKKFDPSRQSPLSNLDILFKCTTFMGFGITLAQFGKIMLACSDCDRHVFIDSLRRHDCDGEPQEVSAPDFSIMTAIHRPGCVGLSAEDVEQLFHVCDTCRRVYLFRYHTLHDCTDLGLVESSSRHAAQADDYDEY